MPNDHVPATDAGLPKKPKTVGDCQRDAVMLSALIDGLWVLSEEGTQEASNACNAMIDILKEKAAALADELDELDTTERRATA